MLHRSLRQDLCKFCPAVYNTVAIAHALASHYHLMLQSNAVGLELGSMHCRCLSAGLSKPLKHRSQTAGGMAPLHLVIEPVLTWQHKLGACNHGSMKYAPAHDMARGNQRQDCGCRTNAESVHASLTDALQC